MDCGRLVQSASRHTRKAKSRRFLETAVVFVCLLGSLTTATALAQEAVGIDQNNFAIVDTSIDNDGHMSLGPTRFFTQTNSARPRSLTPTQSLKTSHNLC